MKKTIMVVGATGTLGGMIARTLLAQGMQVRVTVRPGSGYLPLVDSGAESVYGDMKNPASLQRACQGVDTVITTANSALRSDPDTVDAVDLKGNHDLIDAAKDAGVRHFIFVSALGASTESPVPFMRAKGLAEEHLKSSGMTYTILEPNAFMEVWPGMVVGMPALHRQPVTLVGSGQRQHSFISLRDVAAFAVAAVNNPAGANATLVLGGPQPLSFRDCVAVYRELLEHEIPITTVPPGEPVPGLGAFMSAMLASFDTFDSPVDMTETARTFGVMLTPFTEVARTQVAESIQHMQHSARA